MCVNEFLNTNCLFIENKDYFFYQSFFQIPVWRKHARNIKKKYKLKNLIIQYIAKNFLLDGTKGNFFNPVLESWKSVATAMKKDAENLKEIEVS